MQTTITCIKQAKQNNNKKKKNNIYSGEKSTLHRHN